MTSVGNVPVICGEGYTPTVPRSNGGWGGSLNDYDLIEVLDSTSSSSKDPLNLLSYLHIGGYALKTHMAHKLQACIVTESRSKR